VRRATKLLAVEPQVFDLLAYLVSNRERVVSKDDLIAAVWGGLDLHEHRRQPNPFAGDGANQSLFIPAVSDSVRSPQGGTASGVNVRSGSKLTGLARGDARQVRP
jgi:hypothetical protein